MKIQFVCLLLVLLSATVLSKVGNVRYRKFMNQHIDGKMKANKCDNVIKSRGITKTDSNECKETNTFILTSIKYVTAICGKAGEPDRNMRKSLKPFPIIVCKLKNEGARRSRCQYRGQARTRDIVIKCEQGLPVHFDEDIIHFGK